jgi:indole-3-glycerol phosphate synthase
MSILDEIFGHKAQELQEQKLHIPEAEIRARAAKAAPALDFLAALRDNRGGRPALIAEIKCASPSRGLIAPDFNPMRLARLYQENGAAALSVLTEQRYFKGSLDYLRQIADVSTHVPLLRKDFLFDPYQIYEARANGADAILLIAAYLGAERLCELQALANGLGMAALVEVHDQAELESVVAACHPPLIGINNRDLRDFTVKLETTLRLREFVPAGTCLVAESGIHDRADVDVLAAANISAILVGEALVSAPDIAEKVRSLAC